MATIKKQKPKPYDIFVDTSSLWYEKKDCVVDPKFEAFWNQYSSEFELCLLLPEVVRGELLYQHTSPALKALSRANSAILEVSDITNKHYSHRVTEERIVKEVTSKIDSWVSSHSALVVETPVSKIQWNDVIENSIWRNPPFSKEEKKEKGFRDAMILETICNYIGRHGKDGQIVLLCRDKLLRETTEERLSDIDGFFVFEYIGDLESYLDLTKEELESKFIKAIVRRANRKFFKSGDRSCLAYKEEIVSRIRDEYGQHLDSPRSTQPQSSTVDLLGIPSEASWEPLSDGKFWVSGAQFQEVQGKNLYHWKTPLTFVRPFRRAYPSSTAGSLFDLLPIEEKLLVVEFEILWAAKITTDGRFRNMTLGNVEMGEREFRAITEDDRRRWEI